MTINRYPLIDSVERVTGTIGFTEDYGFPGMLHAKILRSVYPHALIKHIDTEAAKRVPGVLAVLTGQDLVDDPGISPHYGIQIKDQSVLAIDRVRYIGDPVVAVAAVSIEAAEEALQQVFVEYERLPAVYDEVEAAQEAAPVLHDLSPDGLGSNAYFGIRVYPDTNICNHFIMRDGDIEQGFAEAVHIVEGEFRTPTAAHMPMEAHSVVAHFEDDELVVYSGTQSPFNVRKELAVILGMPLENIAIVVPRIGGGFGAKMFARMEPIAVVLARATRRPVKLVLDREEEFLTINRHPVTSRMRIGFDAEGHIVAKEVIAYYGTGAYADCGPNVAYKGGYGSVGPYKTPNFAVDSYCTYTNLPPNGAYRGYAVTQVAWPTESLMDEAAQLVGIDPVELRLRNVLADGDVFPTGETMHDAQYALCLKTAAEGIDWDPEHDWQPYPTDQPLPRKIRGKGFAMVLKGTTTPSRSEAAVEIADDGGLILHMGTIDIGQGCRTAMAQTASEVLDVPYDSIRVLDPDTATTPFDNRTSSSRSAYMMSNAVGIAANDLVHQLKDICSELLNVEPSDLAVRNAGIEVRDDPGRRVSFADLAEKFDSKYLRGDGKYENEGGLDPETGKGIASSHWHQGALGVEIEVDTRTGFIKLLKLFPAVYAGKVINPQAADMQTQGSAIMGIGTTFYEDMIFNDGQAANLNLSDYMIPSIMDMADDMSHENIELPGADVHGLGETALPVVPAAVGNALANALGARIYDLPLTPEKVLRLIHETRGRPIA